MRRQRNKWTSRVCCGAVAGTMMFAAGCATNTLALREQGETAMAHGNYQAAAAKFQAVLKVDPADARALGLLGKTQLKLGHPLSAELALEQSLTLQPYGSAATPGLLDEIAEAMWRRHRIMPLRAFLQHQVNQRGTVADYLRQGRYLAKLGDMDQAKLAYRKAAYFAPAGDAGPYMAIAKFYESINDIPDAKKALRYAYYVDPGDPRIADALRRYNIVPGPTAKLAPPKPALLEQQ